MCKECGCSESSDERKEVYKCENCGKISEEVENCCGKPMKKKE